MRADRDRGLEIARHKELTLAGLLRIRYSNRRDLPERLRDRSLLSLNLRISFELCGREMRDWLCSRGTSEGRDRCRGVGPVGCRLAGSCALDAFVIVRADSPHG